MKALATDTGWRVSKDARASRAGGAPSNRVPARGKEAVKSGSGLVRRCDLRLQRIRRVGYGDDGIRTQPRHAEAEEPIALSSILRGGKHNGFQQIQWHFHVCRVGSSPEGLGPALHRPPLRPGDFSNSLACSRPQQDVRHLADPPPKCRSRYSRVATSALRRAGVAPAAPTI